MKDNDTGALQILSRGSVALTLAISALVIIVSSLGIFFEEIYAKEAQSWVVQAIGQDIANLISIPILLGSAFLARKRSVSALMVWLGVLLFLIYAFVIYAFDVHYNRLFLLYVAALSLSFYAFFGRMINLNLDSLKLFSSSGKAKAVSIFLAVIAVLFYFQWLGQDIPAVWSNEVPADVKETGIPTNPVHVLDLGFFLPAMIITSILLWKKHVVGYLFAAPLLVFSILTGAGILFASALARLGGASVSYVPDAVVGTIVFASVVLTWLHLSEVRKGTNKIDSDTTDRKGEAAAA